MDGVDIILYEEGGICSCCLGSIEFLFRYEKLSYLSRDIEYIIICMN